MKLRWKYITENSFRIQYNPELDYLGKNRLIQIAKKVQVLNDKWDTPGPHNSVLGDNYIGISLTDKVTKGLLIVIETRKRFEEAMQLKIRDMQQCNDKVYDGQNKIKKVLDIFVITEGTADFGGLYVVRKHEILPGVTRPTNEFKTAKTLEEARKLIPEGKTCLPRELNDDVVIVESWI